MIAIWRNIYFLDPIVIFVLNFSRKIQLLLVGLFVITYIYVILKCNIYSNQTIALMVLILLDVSFQQIIWFKIFFLPPYFHTQASYFRIFLNSLPQFNGFFASFAQFIIRLILRFLSFGHIGTQALLCFVAGHFICKTRACINPAFDKVYAKNTLGLVMLIWAILLAIMMLGGAVSLINA
jgi:hypothetical protein